MKNFFKNLQFIFRPTFWNMLCPYDKNWDIYLNDLLDKYPVKLGKKNPINGEYHYVTFNVGENEEINVWIQNYPYAYGTKYNFLVSRDEPRPSRLTILKLRKKQMELLKQKP